MEYTDYLWYKAIALCVIVGVVNFVYAFITGQTIEEARNDAALKPPFAPSDSAKDE